jgi:hypothetical protein
MMLWTMASAFIPKMATSDPIISLLIEDSSLQQVRKTPMSDYLIGFSLAKIRVPWDLHNDRLRNSRDAVCRGLSATAEGSTSRPAGTQRG